MYIYVYIYVNFLVYFMHIYMCVCMYIYIHTHLFIFPNISPADFIGSSMFVLLSIVIPKPLSPLTLKTKTCSRACGILGNMGPE